MSAPNLISPTTLSGGTPVGGTGTTNTIPRWTGPSTLGDSIITQSGAVGAQTITIARPDSATAPLLALMSTTALSGDTLALRVGVSSPANYYFDFTRSVVTGALLVQGNQAFYNNICLAPTSGNVGIGTASPAARLHSAGGNTGYGFACSGTTRAFRVEHNTTETRIVGVDNTLNASFQPLAIGGSEVLFQFSGVTAWRVNTSGHLLAGADNTYDIGASGATRPRTVYVGTNVVVGSGASAAGANANAIGASATASGAYALAIGRACISSGDYSVTTGIQSNAPNYGQVAHSANIFSFVGDAQKSLLLARRQTTDGASTVLYLDGTSKTAALANNTAWAADVHVVARRSGGADHAYFVRRVLIKRDANAASTALVGTVQTIGTDIGSNAGSPPAGWAIAITADTTNGAMQIAATGAVGQTINWVARVELVEVGLA